MTDGHPDRRVIRRLTTLTSILPITPSCADNRTCRFLQGEPEIEIQAPNWAPVHGNEELAEQKKKKK